MARSQRPGVDDNATRRVIVHVDAKAFFKTAEIGAEPFYCRKWFVIEVSKSD